MKKPFYWIAVCIIFSLILPGCATLKKKSSELTHGMSKQQILETWGEPKEKVNLGISKNNYPVEVWTYYKKGIALLAKEEYCILIFVDEELYKWAINEPEEIFRELVKLGALKPGMPEFTQTQSQRNMQDTVNQAEQTRKMMEVIRTYNFFQNTQRDIQTMQNIRNMQQQQQLFPPPPPPQRPAKPLQR